MTPSRRLLLLVLAAAAGGCVPTQRAIRGQARGSEAWSWRMSATQGRWSRDGVHRGQVAQAAAAAPEPGASTAEPEPAADDAEMTLEPDHVAPAAKPKALVARAAKGKRAQAATVDLKTSDSDEEFVNNIIDANADAEDGEITMSAMELPKGKAERAAAKKKLSAPVADIVPDEVKAPAPAKKKHMTRAEKRRAKLMARLEKKKAKEMAAREARLRGKRARIDPEETERASSARKDRRSKKHKGAALKPEGFIDEDDPAADDDEDSAASDGDDEDDDAASDEDDSGDDESDDDDSVVVVTSKKKAKPMAAPAKPAASKPSASKPAARGKVARVKSDWRGQAIDDEDPLKSKKK